MIRLPKVLFVGVVFVLGASCGKRGRGLPVGEGVDLVREWGLERAKKVVVHGWPLSSATTEVREVTLSRPEELSRFFDGFRHAILGVQRHMLVLGTFEIEFENGHRYEGVVLLDRSDEWYFDQVAVQRRRDNIYFLPHHFLRDWKERFWHKR
jgi:hypothetical protein